MDFKIIGSGSTGNCTILQDTIAIDMGVSYKSLSPYVEKLKIVLLTHIHCDHFRKSTIKRLAQERPTIRFACGEFLKQELLQLGVKNIDVLKNDLKYDYRHFQIAPIKLYHDVPNYGWRVYFDNERAIYMTDTKSVDNISAKNYDLYLIEADYEDAELQQRIKEKEENGMYVYEYSVPDRHLSKAQADNFIYENIGNKGVYVYMHIHGGLSYGSNGADLQSQG